MLVHCGDFHKTFSDGSKIGGKFPMGKKLTQIPGLCQNQRETGLQGCYTQITEVVHIKKLWIKILNIKITGSAKAIFICLYIPITEILTVQRQLGIWDQSMHFSPLVWFLFSINRHIQGSRETPLLYTKCVQHWSWKLFLYLAEITTHMVVLGQHLLKEAK